MSDERTTAPSAPPAGAPAPVTDAAGQVSSVRTSAAGPATDEAGPVVTPVGEASRPAAAPAALRAVTADDKGSSSIASLPAASSPALAPVASTTEPSNTQAAHAGEPPHTPAAHAGEPPHTPAAHAGAPPAAQASVVEEDPDPFPRRRHGLLQSFNWAIEGLVWTLRHQRNMQIHFAIAVVVIVAALVFSVTRVELLMVFAAITFVFVAEMINTAVEYTVDLTISDKHPAAKIAKDVAAGAVFVAALNALAVAYLVFYDSIVDIPYSMLHRLRISEVDLTVVALMLTGLLVIVFKAAVGRGSALRGGWPSGHAAIAFGGWTAVTFIAIRTPYAIPISFVALIMAFLAAQSRVQAHIHTWVEVVAGGLLGVVVTAGVFFIWNPL